MIYDIINFIDKKIYLATLGSNIDFALIYMQREYCAELKT